MVVVLCQFKNWYFSNFWWGNACIDGYVSKRKSDWISARIYYFPHHVTEYPDSTRVPENFWIFTRRILLGLDIYPRGPRVRPGLPTPKSGKDQSGNLSYLTHGPLPD